MSTPTQWHVEQTGERLDVFLTRVLPQYSRSFWQKMCEQETVLVNNQPRRSSYIVQAGQTVLANVPVTPDFSHHTLPIIYEDDDVLVINKPAGVLTHAKGQLNPEFSVAEFVRPRTIDGADTNRPGIVHRLDRGTSGVMVAAKNPAAKRWLQAQFSQRKVKKTYIALVKGHLDDKAATLVLPIERNPAKPQTFRVGPNGKPATTKYEVEHTYSDASLLRLHPLTGRTHQLRVHLAYLHHPIVGDVLYGVPDKTLQRMFLHAAELELTLPSKERKRFVAPLPQELVAYLKTL